MELLEKCVMGWRFIIKKSKGEKILKLLNTKGRNKGIGSRIKSVSCKERRWTIRLSGELPEERSSE